MAEGRTLATDKLRPMAVNLLGYFTRHRTVANLLLILMLGAGAVALPQMRAQFFPDVIVDDITVQVRWSGAGPEDVDRAISQVLGSALLAVDGVSSLSGRSVEGAARLALEFEPGWDMVQAADDVILAIDEVSENLPDEADDPFIIRSSWRDRIADVIITGPVSIDQLGRFADEFVARLFEAEVTRTTIRGYAAPSTVVEVASFSLRKHNLTMADIADAIAEEALADPAGDVSSQGRVRAGVAKRSSEDIGKIVLRTYNDGSRLTIGDLATVKVEGIDRSEAYFVGEDPALSIRVDRSAEGDALEIERTVREVAAEFAATLPEGTSIDIIRSRAEIISGRLNILLDNGIMGLSLVLVLLFLFLNSRTAFWVAAGIPVAMSATLALMFVMGLTINMISLFALIITLGIVVDDAIVVGEHADYRARVLGESPSEAAENAARRMFTPVFSATITTVIAFFGLTAIGGRFGNFVGDIPVTVVAVLIASLVECFLILPHHMRHSLMGQSQDLKQSGRRFIAGMVVVPLALGLVGSVAWSMANGAPLRIFEGGLWQGALWGAGAGWIALSLVSIASPRARVKIYVFFSGPWYDWPSTQVNRGLDWFKARFFRPFMGLVLRARYLVVAATVLLLAIQSSYVIRGDLPFRFFNAPERSSLTGNFAMLPGATRSDTLEMMKEMQRATEAVGARYEAEHGVNPITYALAGIGSNTGGGLAGADTKDPDQLGFITVELIDADNRPYSAFALVADLQEEARRHPLVETISFRGWRSGPGDSALDVQFTGSDTQTLKQASLALQSALAQFSEVSAVEDNLSFDKKEFVLDLTAQGQALGFTIDGVGRVLRNRLGGVEAATFPEGTRTATISVELPESELTADFLNRTELRTPAGEYVQLADIVKVESRTGFSTIRRENGLLVISVTGDISEDDPARASQIMDALTTEILPDIAQTYSVEYDLAGLAEQERNFFGDAGRGLVLCLGGIFITLAWIFSSWTRPLVVMSIIPFGFIGTVYGHMAWDVPLSIFSIIGLIGMVGIIINDSIVLVTTIDQYAEKRGILRAIVDGSVDRLRPVLLTTLTTVLGLTPLLFEGSVQAEFLKPTIITLVYGLGVGMFLVLLIVPSVLAIQEDIAKLRVSSRRGGSGLFRSSGRARALGMAVWAGWLGAVAIFAITVGHTMLFGQVWPMIAGLASPVMSSNASAASLFVGGLAVWLAIVFACTAFALSVGSKGSRSKQASP